MIKKSSFISLSLFCCATSVLFSQVNYHPYLPLDFDLKKSQTDPVPVINVYQTCCHGMWGGGGGDSAALVFLVPNSLLH